MSEPAIQIQNFSKTYPVPRQKQKRVAVERPFPRCACRRPVRLFGAERRGQDHHHQDVAGLHPADLRRGVALRAFPSPTTMPAAASATCRSSRTFPSSSRPQEVVRAHAGLAGVAGAQVRERTEACLRQVDMWDNRHMTLAKCSKGMTQARRPRLGAGRRPRPAHHG